MPAPCAVVRRQMYDRCLAVDHVEDVRPVLARVLGVGRGREVEEGLVAVVEGRPDPIVLVVDERTGAHERDEVELLTAGEVHLRTSEVRLGEDAEVPGRTAVNGGRVHDGSRLASGGCRR